VRRLLVVILFLFQFAIATGAMSYVHELLHGDGQGRVDHAVEQMHDESHCTMHEALVAPTIFTPWVPLLVALGLFVAFLTEIPRSVVSLWPHFRLDCRGPPASC
jgi:hypothetical protein